MLRRALLRLRHGPAYADHRLRAERRVAALPEGRATRAWRAWLWRLPPQAWDEAIDLRSLVDDPEAEARALTRRGRAGTGTPEEAQAIRDESRQRGRELAERRRAFAQRWGEPPA